MVNDMKKGQKIFYSLRAKFVDVIDSTVFFISFNGQYNDNPKYVSECLHAMHPEISIVWCVSEHGNETPPGYAKTVHFGSDEYYKYLYSSKVVVDNYTGCGSFGFYNGKGLLKRWLVSSYKQLCISTWHGTPLKKIGQDTLKSKPRGYASTTTYCVAGCEYTANCLKHAYFFDDRMKLVGTPRNDILFKDKDIISLKYKLGLPNKKIVLYAPTFRESVLWSGIEQLRLIDIDVLLQTLTKRFSGEFAFVFRVHHSVLGKIKTEGLLEFDSNTVINGNIGDDMAEYLVCSDVLITDYSGSLFDYALTKKPCFLFAPDRDYYEHVWPGFLMQYDQVPYPIAEDFASLIDNIKDYDEKTSDQKRISFLKTIGNVEDGHASERIVEDIVTYLKK